MNGYGGGKVMYEGGMDGRNWLQEAKELAVRNQCRGEESELVDAIDKDIYFWGKHKNRRVRGEGKIDR